MMNSTTKSANKVLIFHAAQEYFKPFYDGFAAHLTSLGYECIPMIVEGNTTETINISGDINQYHKIVYICDAVWDVSDKSDDNIKEYLYDHFYNAAIDDKKMPDSIKNSNKVKFIAMFNHQDIQDKNKKYRGREGQKILIYAKKDNSIVLVENKQLKAINAIFPKIENKKIDKTAAGINSRKIASGALGTSSAVVGITMPLLNKIQKGMEKGSVPKIETLKKLVDYIQEQQGKSILLDKRTIGAICTLITLACVDYHIREGASFISQVKGAIAGRGQAQVNTK